LMDNDDLRRGRPTCHRVYGEATAALAGDALQAAAFRLISEAGQSFENPAAALEAVAFLARMAGEEGMCLGQYRDMRPGERTAEELTAINEKKTGCLLRAAAVLGVLAANGYRSVATDLVPRADRYAAALGRAFQIRDDMLDAISTEAELGKPIGSDAENGKQTFAALWGLEKCAEAVRRETEAALLPLEPCTGSAATFLRDLALSLAERRS
ncbi:MAG: polyprenyl synthetase family protein, partial [bacterium]